MVPYKAFVLGLLVDARIPGWLSLSKASTLPLTCPNEGSSELGVTRATSTADVMTIN